MAVLGSDQSTRQAFQNACLNQYDAPCETSGAAMRRREFIRLAGGVAAWPIAAYAQQQSMPLIGFVSSRAPEESKPHLAGFLRGLEAFGYVDGKTATIEYRWAQGQYDRLPKLAAELVDRHPAVIAAAGGAPSARAAKLATTSIPILFVTSDSVREGLVASLNRPGGNVTGVDLMSGELSGKRLELLAQLVAAGRAIAFLANPSGAQSTSKVDEVERAAQALGRALVVVNASTDAELDSGFSRLATSGAAGLVVENDPYFDSRREHLIELTAQRSIPAIYHIREFPVAGGLMSYGASLVEAYYQMGVQVGRILKGASIADLPVIRPTKFELALNLKTAKALGLVIPPNLLAIADEVID
jgi:putative ABC transport system substrate-binding protein